MKGRASPAPHRVAIAESVYFNSNSTAYNQTISTSVRRTSARLRQNDSSGRRIAQSYHEFRDLAPPSEPRTIRMTPSSAFFSKPEKTSASDELDLTLQQRQISRLAKPRSILTPPPSTNATPREEKGDILFAHHKAPSVIDAVRSYTATHLSSSFPVPRDVLCGGSGNDKSVGSVSRSRPMSSNILSYPSVEQSPPAFASQQTSAPLSSREVMNDASKRALLRSSELETLVRLANMDM